ncbi:MAG: hypothetical protein HY282_14395 [Nitrospirae bacterium]|nr:hypothetical protein [Candidatus Manganitrophaceae bacterium]
MPKSESIQRWVIYKQDDSGEEVCCLTLEGLARFSRLPLSSVRRMQEEGLISPMAGADRLFPQEMIRRIVKIERLRTQLQIDLGGVEVILRLLDRMELLERELAALRRERPFP